MFFLLSGYGLIISKDKKGYLTHFWRNRIASLFVPMILVNVLRLCVCHTLVNETSTLRSLFYIDGFVLMMTLCYVAFYAIYGFDLIKKYKIVGICVLTSSISILTYLFKDFFPFSVWPVPCLGFMYGVLFAEYEHNVKNVFGKV